MLAFVPSRRLQILLWLFTCLFMAVAPTINHFRGGNNKDYPLWYQTGQKVMARGQAPPGMEAVEVEPDGRLDIYPVGKSFPFMYPPFAGIILGLLSLLGEHAFFFILVALNAVSLAAAIELSVWLVAGTTQVPLGLRLIPSALCLFFLNDMFFLGQPNLGLLALMLGGLGLIRLRREWSAGFLFAAAAAIKAYPVVVIVYLLWRRHWAAAASLTLFTAVFLALVPAPIRGFERNLAELRTWANGMIFDHGKDGIGQRPEQSQSWQNQSIFGVGHRLLRHVDADRAQVGAGNLLTSGDADKRAEARRELERIVAAAANSDASRKAGPIQEIDREWIEKAAINLTSHDDTERGLAERFLDARFGQETRERILPAINEPHVPLYVNLLDLDYQSASLAILFAAGLLGLGYVVVMPPSRQRTHKTDASEFAMLMILITIGTPYAYTYYAVWMLYPYTVLVHRGMGDADRTVRRVCWGAIIISASWYAIGVPVFGDHTLQAIGSMFWAEMALLFALGWLILHDQEIATVAYDATFMKK